jgi:hypothetical protein
MELEIIVLQDLNQAQNTKYQVFFSYTHSRPKIIIMIIIMMMMMMGHECHGGLCERMNQWGWGKERTLRNE